jgi:hypothetical protein
MPTAGEILQDFVLPAIIVAVGLVIGVWPWGRKPGDGRWIGAIAVSAAFALADCGIGGTPRWPPGSGDASYWLVWFAIVVALAGLLDALLKPPFWLRAGVIFVLMRAGGALLVTPLVPHGAGDAAAIWSMGIGLDIAALAATLWWMGLETFAEKNPGPVTPLVLTITLLGLGGALALGNDIKPSQLAVALMGMAIAATVVAAIWKNISLARGAILAWVVPVLGTLAVVHFYYYTEPPALAVGLLLIAPLLAFCGDLPAAQKLGPKGRLTVRLAPVALAVLAGLGLAAQQFFHSQANDSKTASQQDEY